jgi:cytochrome c553
MNASHPGASRHWIPATPGCARVSYLALVLNLLTIALPAAPAHARGYGTSTAASGGAPTVCAGCHNVDGNSVMPENPKLAGLDSEYIMKQLTDFKSGKRASPVMSVMVQQLPEVDFETVATYFADQKRTRDERIDARLAAQGKAIYQDGIVGSAVPACAGCHNADGSGTAKYPRLASQHAAYVVNQLNNFRTGVRANDQREVMRAVAGRLNEQQIRAVAEYISGLQAKGQ